MNEGNAAYGRVEFARAKSLYSKGLREATLCGNPHAQNRFEFGVANCEYLSFNFSTALDRYLRVRDLSLKEGDLEMAALASISVYETYSAMGDHDASATSMLLAKEILAKAPPSRRQSQVLLDIGWSYYKEWEIEHNAAALAPAVSNLRAALEVADAGEGNSPVIFSALCRLADLSLRTGDLAAAERYITAAYRQGEFFLKPGRSQVYLRLARLRNAQHRPSEALYLVERAIQTRSSAAPPIALWLLLLTRSEAHRQLGKLQTSLDDLAAAINEERVWRLSTTPADSVRTNSDFSVRTLFEEYIDISAELYRTTGRVAYARRAFEAAESGRALTFRERIGTEQHLPDAFLEKVARVRQMEVRNLGRPATKERESLTRAHLELAQMEALFSPSTELHESKRESHENIPSGGSLQKYQSLIGRDEVVISFYLTERRSYIWTLENQQFEMHVLPPIGKIAEEVRRFREVVQANSPDVSKQSEYLYQLLFSSLNPRIESKRDWILVLDDSLFELPFAALRKRTADEVRYLVENHSLRVLPAVALLEPSPKEPPGGHFLGIADPILNRADSRWQGRRTGTIPVPLARLPGTAIEIGNAARAWRSESGPVLLNGAALTRDRLEKELSDSPRITHFATHVVQNPRAKELAMIAIGLDKDGEADFLSPTELSRCRFRLGLVTLSGCGSGLGKSVPGAGLFGLTRSWLLAGATAVTASLWAVPDDSGAIFQPFYDHLANQSVSAGAVARSLRLAQLEMLNSKSWRSEPRYWTSYFVMGKS